MIKTASTLFLIFLLSTGISNAQESMMPSVNYAFLDKLVMIAKENYPRMKKYQHRVEQAKINIRKSQLGWFDALTLSYASVPTTTTNAAVGFQPGVYLNLGTLLAKGPGIKMAREDLAITQEELAEFDLNIEATVKDRYYTYIQKLSIVNLRTLASNDAETSQRQIKYKFEKGEESFDNYSKALVMFSVSTQNKIEAEGAALIAKSSLEEIIGKKLEEVK